MNENPYLKNEVQGGAAKFRELFLPTLIYAVVYTFCLYDNFSGILVAIFALSTIIYCRYVEKRQNITEKKASRLCELMMLLLGISNGLTGNEAIIALNTIGIALLLIVRLLHNFCDDSKWQFGKYLESICFAVGGAIGSLPDFFSDAGAFARSDKAKDGKGRTLTGVLIGVAIAVPLLIVIIALLYSADIVFASLLKNTFQIDGATVIGVLCMFAFALLSAYCGMRFFGKHSLKEDVRMRKKFSATVAITTLALIAVVYLVFSGIQIAYLFVGGVGGQLTLPDNYTYAEYARQGFFQLLAVAVLNLVIVLLVPAFFEEHRALKVLLTLISACTYIMIASSAMRMLLYIDAYNLTRKRVLVLWALMTIAILLVGIVISTWKADFPLFAFGVAAFCVCYLLLSFSRMDYFIAKYNVAAIAADGEVGGVTGSAGDAEINGTTTSATDGIRSGDVANTDAGAYADDYYDEHHPYIEGHDLNYLATLSTDAAPVIMRENGDFTLDFAARHADVRDDTLRQWNFSRQQAKKLFSEIDAKQSVIAYIERNQDELDEVVSHYKKMMRTNAEDYYEMDVEAYAVTCLGVNGGYEVADDGTETADYIVQFEFLGGNSDKTVRECGFYYSPNDTAEADQVLARYVNYSDEVATDAGKAGDTWEYEIDGVSAKVRTERLSGGWYYYEIYE